MDGVKEDVQTENVDDVEDYHICLCILSEKQGYGRLSCLQDNYDNDSQDNVEDDCES